MATNSLEALSGSGGFDNSFVSREGGMMLFGAAALERNSCTGLRADTKAERTERLRRMEASAEIIHKIIEAEETAAEATPELSQAS